jgi:hypothetical protein
VSKSYDGASWTYYSNEFDDVTAYGSVNVADDIVHLGDTDTKISFSILINKVNKGDKSNTK